MNSRKIRLVSLLVILIGVTAWGYLIENPIKPTPNLDKENLTSDNSDSTLQDTMIKENNGTVQRIAKIPIRKNLFEKRHWNTSIKTAYGLTPISNSHHPERSAFSINQQLEWERELANIVNSEPVEEIVVIIEPEPEPEPEPVVEIKQEPPPPPALPKINYTFLGSLKKANNSIEAFIIKNGEVTTIKEGETINSIYRVVKISENALSLLHTPDGRTTNLGIYQ